MGIITKQEYERSQRIEQDPHIIQCEECGEYFDEELEGAYNEDHVFCSEFCKESFEEKRR